MRIAIPREILGGERRVAATPETVSALRKAGYQVAVERGAGDGIACSDEDYRTAGAEIVGDPRQLFEQSEVVIKVKQPCFNASVGRHEAEMIREGAILVTFLHPATPSNHETIETLRRRNVISFTMDSIPRISRAQRMDALTSMSTVTGYKAVLDAACRLPRFVPMMGTAIGTLKPASFLVVGIGVVGLQALATIKRLGGTSTCVDIRQAARDEGKSLGAKVGGFAVPAEVAQAEGGYALALPEELVEEERTLLAPLVRAADVVVLSALVPGEVAPVLVTRQAIRGMRPGSVIVDVAIDQGGNCSETKAGEIVAVDGVLVCGTQNIPGSVPVHATQMYATNMLHYLENLFKQGPGKVDWDDDIVRASLVTREGRILHVGTLKAMGRS